MNAMAFIPAVDTARVEFVYNVFQQTCENVVYVQNEAPWTSVTLEQLAEACADWWATEMAPITSDSVTMSLVRCTDVAVANSWQVEYTPPVTITGTVTSPALPLNVTCAIKFGSGLTGRSQRGRSYFVGLAENRVTGNELAAGTAAEIVGAWEEFEDTLQVVSPFWTHVVVSYRTNNADRVAAQILDVVSYSTDGFVDSQRRRLSGRGS